MPNFTHHGNGVRVILTPRFIQILGDHRIFSHQSPSVQRWESGHGMIFLKTTEMEPYTAVYRGEVMFPLGAYSFMTLPVTGAYDIAFKTGRYCSIGGGVKIVGNAHPITTLSSSPIFYEKGPSWVASAYADAGITDGPFVTRQAAKGLPTVGNDVWFGADVTLNQAVKIGNGSVVAAGSHVTKDVPDYAIVGGNPAKLIKYRFPPEIVSELQAIQFWKYSMPDLKQFNMQDIEIFIREFRDAEKQLTPWEPAKLNLWNAWLEAEG